MKKTNYTLIVLRKELLDITRNRRSLIIGLILPLIFYPIIFGFSGRLATSIQKETLSNTTVAFMGSAAAEAQSLVGAFLEESEGVSVLSFDDPVEALRNGDVKVLLNAEGSHPCNITLIQDSDKIASLNSASYIQQLLTAFNETEMSNALADMGIDLISLYPVNIGTTTLSAYIELTTGEKPQTGSGGVMLGMMVPMFAAMILATGGMAPALDMFAGEKDRKTFEPLLTTRAGRYPILLGKYIAVNIQGTLTGLFMLVGIVIGLALTPSYLNLGGEQNVDFRMPLPLILLSLLLIVLMAMVFNGLHVTMSAGARTMKEASSRSSFVMIAMPILSVVTLNIQAGDVSMWMMIVPALNVICAMKMILAGMVKYPFIALAIGSTAVFLAAIMLHTVHLFKKEHVMFRA